jgi:serine/threonine protein kinase
MLDYDKSEKPTWYVMPVMEGGTLKDKQDLVGNVPAVVRGMLQVARALAALHSQSHPITHRDIKPGNVFVSGSGEWILGDPGVAYRDDGSDETETRAVSKDWAPRWYADKFARSPKADLYLLGATAIAVLVGEKPLDPSYLDEPAFKLPTRFPEAPGIELLFQLFRKLVVTRLAAMPYKDATELVRELETLLPVIENDRSLDLLAELERFRSVPRLLFSYANSNANLFSGDHDGLKGVPLLIPEDCDRLVIWPRGVKQAGCGLMIFDRWNRQAKASIDLLEYDRPTSLELPADTRGEFVRMTVTRNSGMLYSLTVYAEHGGRRFG